MQCPNLHPCEQLLQKYKVQGHAVSLKDTLSIEDEKIFQGMQICLLPRAITCDIPHCIAGFATRYTNAGSDMIWEISAIISNSWKLSASWVIAI